MATYVTLIRWTDQGRREVASIADRIDAVNKRVEQAGGKMIGNFVTMGRFDQVAIVEAPNDETAGKLALMVAERGNAVTETLRGFSTDEVRKMM